MAYDREIADRVRAALARQTSVTERAMFGTLVFMVDGRMVVAAAQDGLLVRAGDDALAEPHVRPATMGTRAMKGWVLVGRDADLDAWVARGLSGSS